MTVKVETMLLGKRRNVVVVVVDLMVKERAVDVGRDDQREMKVTVMMMVVVDERSVKGKEERIENSQIQMMVCLLNNVERLFLRQQFHLVMNQIQMEPKSYALTRRVVVMVVVAMLEKGEELCPIVKVMMKARNLDLTGLDQAVDLLVDLGLDQDLEVGLDQDLEVGQDPDLEVGQDQGQGQNLVVGQDLAADQGQDQGLEVDLGLEVDQGHDQDLRAFLQHVQEVPHRPVQVVDHQVDLDLLLQLALEVYHQLDQDLGHQGEVVEAAQEGPHRTVTKASTLLIIIQYINVTYFCSLRFFF